MTINMPEITFWLYSYTPNTRHHINTVLTRNSVHTCPTQACLIVAQKNVDVPYGTPHTIDYRFFFRLSTIPTKQLLYFAAWRSSGVAPM